MPLVMVPYAARGNGDHANVTALTAAAEREDLVALAWDDGYIADPLRAVYDGHRRHGIAIYRGAERIAITTTRWVINDVAFHPTRDEVLIATGAYDGGYMFDGELLLWDWRANTTTSLLGESREIANVRWRDPRTIVARISPPNDSDDQVDYLEFTLDTHANQPLPIGAPVAEPPPNQLLSKYRKTNRARITALAWTNDGCLAIGRDRTPSLLLWDPATNASTELNTFAPVHGLWLEPERLLVEVHHERESTVLFALTDELRRVHEWGSIHGCSIDAAGRILARGVTSYAHYQRRTPHSALIDGAREQHLELGNYDVFNHPLRVDGGTELYYLQSTPPDSHTAKRLFAITPSGEHVVRMLWDREPQHLMSPIAARVDDRRLARGYLVHRSNPHAAPVGMIELDDLRTGSAIWTHPIASGIAAMVVWQGCVVAGLLDGTLLALAIETGKVLHHEPFVFGVTSAMVTAMATHDEALAIGSIDGRIAIVTSR